MNGVVLLVALLLIGIVSRSNLIATAACVLLIIKFANLNFIFPLLEIRAPLPDELKTILEQNVGMHFSIKGEV